MTIEEWPAAGRDTRSVFVATSRAAADLLREPAVAAAWSEPSALAAMSVGDLAGHLAYQIFVVVDALPAPPSDAPTVSLAEHFSRLRWIGAALDDEISVRIRAGAADVAAGGADGLVARVDAAVDGLAEGLAAAHDGPVRLPLWPSWSTTLDDMLVTRLVELVVHADDLAVSVGLGEPRLPDAAVARVLDVLTRLATRRHGHAAVLRALSRAERAPASIAAF